MVHRSEVVRPIMSELLAGIWTKAWSAPLLVKRKAPPNPCCPMTQAGEFPFSPANVPLLVKPEESFALVLVPSLNLHKPTMGAAAEAFCAHWANSMKMRIRLKLLVIEAAHFI